MKIVFFGTPEFAIPSLDLIIKSNHSLLSVITNINKKSGRGLKEKSSPVKKFCDENFDSEILNFSKFLEMS